MSPWPCLTKTSTLLGLPRRLVQNSVLTSVLCSGCLPSISCLYSPVFAVRRLALASLLTIDIPYTHLLGISPPNFADVCAFDFTSLKCDPRSPRKRRMMSSHHGGAAERPKSTHAAKNDHELRNSMDWPVSTRSDFEGETLSDQVEWRQNSLSLVRMAESGGLQSRASPNHTCSMYQKNLGTAFLATSKDDTYNPKGFLAGRSFTFILHELELDLRYWLQTAGAKELCRQ